MQRQRQKKLIIGMAGMTAVLLALYMAGVLGTTAADFSTMVGSHTIQAADGSTLLALDVAEDGEATADFRGIELRGKLVRTMSKQTGATYTLDVDEASAGDPDKLQFSIQVPPDGFAGDLSGAWCVRFRNVAAQDEDGGKTFVVLGYTPKRVWYAQYGGKSEPPFEVYDFFFLASDGTGTMLNECAIPVDIDDEELAEAGRAVLWVADGDTLMLGEG